MRHDSGRVLTTILGLFVGLVVVALLGLLGRELYVYVQSDPGVDRDAAPATSPSPRIQQPLESSVQPPSDPGSRAKDRRVGPREIRGIVRDESGGPVGGASVLFEEFGGSAGVLARRESGPDGRFSATDLHVRFCTVTVRCEGFVSQTETRISPGETGLEFRLEQGSPVRGTVIADEGGSPVTGAIIRGRSYLQQRRQWREETRTDASGRFELGLAPPGSVTLEVEAPGYQARVVPSLSVSLGTPLEQEIRLRPGLQVRGQVVDGENGRGIPGASVTFGVRLLNEKTIETDGDGMFLIDDLHRGIQYFEVRAEGFGVTKQSLTVTTKDNEAEPVRLELFRSRTLTGVVRGAGDRGPVPQAAVFLAVDTTYFPPRAEPATTTDDAGKFSIADLTAGHEYFLLIRHPEFPDKIVPSINVQEYVDRSLVVQLVSGARVVGRVQTSDGEPIPEARVLISDVADLDEPDERIFASPARMERDKGIADEEGRFAVGNLSPGPKRLVVSAGPEYLTRTVDIPSLEEGATTDEILVVLSRGELIAGKVIDGSGTPLDDVRLQASSNDPQNPSYGSATTGVEGEFRIPQLNGAAFKITARKPGYSMEVIESVLPGTDALTIVLEKNGTVSGSVRSKTTLVPVSRFLVRVTRLGQEEQPFSRSRQFTSDEGGFFFPDIMPGEYRIEVTASDFAPGSFEPVRVVGGQESKNVDILLPEGGVLQGTVTDVHGAPIPRATVFAKAVDARPTGPSETPLTSQSKSVLVEDDGSYRIGGLGSGTYDVYASAPKHSLSDTESILLNDAVVSQKSFVLYAGTTLVVDVFADGQPVPGAKIDVFQGQGEVLPARIQRILERYPSDGEQREQFKARLHRTDRNGSCRITNLPPVGRVTVSASAPDGRGGRETVVLEEGQEVRVEIQVR